MDCDSRIEGWIDDSYIIIFASSERQNLSDAYGLNILLPDYDLIGLVGWDDFVVASPEKEIFIVPSVPAIPEYLKPNRLNDFSLDIETDENLRGKIKWYVKPIIFGGDPESEQNITWISVEEHTKAVRWWNQKYNELTQNIKNNP